MKAHNSRLGRQANFGIHRRNSPAIPAQVTTAPIYQIGNAAVLAASAYTELAKSFDSCIAFDLGQQRCYRRQLSYFSKDGEQIQA